MIAAPALADVLDDLLPQTQCGKCGYAGCRPYAEALAVGSAPINRCAPGGRDGVARIAAALQVEPLPLDPAYGNEGPERLALIDESVCIGCTLCIQACPVDAIVGAAKRMHSVLLEHCTGCELCLPPCPVDCIEMVERDRLAASGATGAKRRQERDTVALRRNARSRYLSHRMRRASGPEACGQGTTRPGPVPTESGHATKRQAIERALLKARQKRATPGSG